MDKLNNILENNLLANGLEVFCIVRGKYDPENLFIVKGCVNESSLFPKPNYKIGLKEFKIVSLRELKKLSNIDNFFDENYEVIFKHYLRNSKNLKELENRIYFNKNLVLTIESELVFKTYRGCLSAVNLATEYFIFNHIRNLHQLSTSPYYKGFLATKNSDDFITRFSKSFYDTTSYTKEEDFIKYLDENL